MNDPGLDDAIADEAGVLDYGSGQENTENWESTEVDSSHPHAARWWLASTAYPLAAVCTVHLCRQCDKLTSV